MTKIIIGIAIGFIIALYPQVAKSWAEAGIDAVHHLGTESAAEIVKSPAANPEVVREVSKQVVKRVVKRQHREEN
jgi:hypothetical protein